MSFFFHRTCLLAMRLICPINPSVRRKNKYVLEFSEKRVCFCVQFFAFLPTNKTWRSDIFNTCVRPSFPNITKIAEMKIKRVLHTDVASKELAQLIRNEKCLFEAKP